MAIVFFSSKLPNLCLLLWLQLCWIQWRASVQIIAVAGRGSDQGHPGPKRCSNIFFPRSNTFQNYTEFCDWKQTPKISENRNQSTCQSTSWPKSVSLEVVYVIIPNKGRGALECLGWKASSPTVSVASPSWCVPLLPTLLRADGRSSGPVHPLSNWPPRPSLHLNLRLLFLGFVTWVMPWRFLDLHSC